MIRVPGGVPRMLLLDTCGSEGGAALAEIREGRTTLLEEVAIAGKTSAAELVPAISGLMRHNGIRLTDLVAVAVVHGPGSFTGVRIGLSTAKGLVEAAAIPLIAISRLAVLSRLSGLTGRTMAIFDAGRGEFYVGIYEGATCIGECLMSHEEVLAAAVEQSTVAQPLTLVVCEERVQAAFAGLRSRVVAQPTPADAMPLAVERWQAAAFDDVLTLDGNYLRRSESEIFSRQAHDIKAKRKVMEASSH